MAIKGKVGIVAVRYKDRLTRFGYEMIERIIREYSGGKIEIMEEEERTEEEEMMMDMLQVMNVFIAKMNGRRKYKNKEIKEKEAKMKEN